jgi:hypothetical protein
MSSSINKKIKVRIDRCTDQIASLLADSGSGELSKDEIIEIEFARGLLLNARKQFNDRMLPGIREESKQERVHDFNMAAMRVSLAKAAEAISAAIASTDKQP